ncbi:hypothetical protein RhiirA4_517737 [Rhizophagus irregularis]|uniref:Uncharacterized protein n=1 Tax=Rhizophagus irregularis TaxID=588596 RepID=A0A2I1HMT5_9GLOM|nr:hypothetical protein RhiirA4_517737 [Rhizophagus irregularis]
MLKVKFTLIINELEVNETYVGRKRNTEENQIEKEFDIFETEDVELYEKFKDDGDIIERMELAYQLKLKEKLFQERNGTNMIICYECLMPINTEQQKENLSEIGKEFKGYCLDCEKEMEFEINNEIVEITTDVEGVMIEEVDDQVMTEESNGESESRENDEESEEETVRRSKVFEELLKDLSVPTVEELLEEEYDEEVTLDKLFMKAVRESREAVKCWYKLGRLFTRKLNKEMNGRRKKEKTARTRIYNELMNKLKGFTRTAIQQKIVRAEKVYKLFKGIGEDKINRMKNTSMNTIIGLKNRSGEIEELINKINKIEEERKNIMEE